MSEEEIAARPVRDVQDVVANQAGVFQDPTGLYIRGGRATETGYVVDGVNAKDPLAGTGFGLDLGANAFGEVEVNDGRRRRRRSASRPLASSPSAHARAPTSSRSGSRSSATTPGSTTTGTARSNEENYEVSLAGPVVPGKLRFFLSGQANFADGFTASSHADQLESSARRGRLLGAAAGQPLERARQARLPPALRDEADRQLPALARHQPEHADAPGDRQRRRRLAGLPVRLRTAARPREHVHADANLSYLLWIHSPTPQSIYEVQVSRLFTRLRADANGRDWRPDERRHRARPVVHPGLSRRHLRRPRPERHPGDPALFILPGPGFYNNGGVATDWHDHFAEQITARGEYTRFSTDAELRVHRRRRGLAQRLPVDRHPPPLGRRADPATDGTTTQSNRLGQSADIWRVKPRKGAFYTTHRIRYNGLIATLGARVEAGPPASTSTTSSPTAPSRSRARSATRYMDETTSAFGLRWKGRSCRSSASASPSARTRCSSSATGTRCGSRTRRTSTPTSTRSTRTAPSSRDLGNPNLNPEVDIAYELGLRNQITQNDALTRDGLLARQVRLHHGRPRADPRRDGPRDDAARSASTATSPASAASR